MAGKQPELTFEIALNRLHEVVAELETESVSLDRSLELFTEGKHLVEYCQDQLAEAEDRINTLIKTTEGFEEQPGLPGSETGTDE